MKMIGVMIYGLVSLFEIFDMCPTFSQEYVWAHKSVLSITVDQTILDHIT